MEEIYNKAQELSEIIANGAEEEQFKARRDLMALCVPVVRGYCYRHYQYLMRYHGEEEVISWANGLLVEAALKFCPVFDEEKKKYQSFLSYFLGYDKEFNYSATGFLGRGLSNEIKRIKKSVDGSDETPLHFDAPTALGESFGDTVSDNKDFAINLEVREMLSVVMDIAYSELNKSHLEVFKLLVSAENKGISRKTQAQKDFYMKTAQRLNISYSALRSRIQAMRNQLRNLLTERGIEPPQKQVQAAKKFVTFSKNELALKADVGEKVVRDLINGRMPSLLNSFKICAVLGIKIKELKTYAANSFGKSTVNETDD
ncbi:hypothetical protein FACS1894120_4280 [Clostridia bacterium]|nr:hypothetical protein FACS1894120_4280 [Clostridia bacterium]